MLVLYNIISILLFPVSFLMLIIRLVIAKETVASLLSKLTIGQRKIDPNKTVIWLHAASVGESRLALSFIGHLMQKVSDNHVFLLTSGTTTSASFVKKHLPPRTYHQFTPMDNFVTISRFLNNWNPVVGIFIESELWPCLILQSSMRAKLFLVSARMSDRSFGKWQMCKPLITSILQSFTAIVTQTLYDSTKFKSLGGKNIVHLGNLKFSNPQLVYNEIDREELLDGFKKSNKKSIFVAASTHHSDELVILEAISKLKKIKADIFFIIVPRYINKVNDTIRLSAKYRFTSSLRSICKSPNWDSDDIYIADSFGELGLFYSVADISFIGGSFRQGGHNILEACWFKNIIITGPDMRNSIDVVEQMKEVSALIQIQNATELSEKLYDILIRPDLYSAMPNNAKQYVQDRALLINKSISIIDSYYKF